MNKNKAISITVLGIVILFIAIALSITYGTKSVGLSHVWDAVLGPNTDVYEVNIVQTRIPRTIFGIIAGASLSISGVRMYSPLRTKAMPSSPEALIKSPTEPPEE